MIRRSVRRPARPGGRAARPGGRQPAVAVAVAAILAPSEWAAADLYDPLSTRINPGVIAKVFPGAGEVDPPTGSPPAATVRNDDSVQGWLFSTFETVNPRGYSGEPFDIIVGLDRAGRITGSAILELHEPMVGPSLIPQSELEDLFAGLRNLDVRRPVRFSGRGVDGVRGATISATLTYNAIVLSARRMARIQGLLGEDPNAGPFHLDTDRYQPRTWQELLDWGASWGVGSALPTSESPAAAPHPESPCFRSYAALATPADVGRNLFGGQWFNHHVSQIAYGDQLLAVLGNGRISWRGNTFRATGRYDRIRLVQGDRSHTFTKSEALTATAVPGRGTAPPGRGRTVPDSACVGVRSAGTLDPRAHDSDRGRRRTPRTRVLAARGSDRGRSGGPGGRRPPTGSDRVSRTGPDQCPRRMATGLGRERRGDHRAGTAPGRPLGPRGPARPDLAPPPGPPVGAPRIPGGHHRLARMGSKTRSSPS